MFMKNHIVRNLHMFRIGELMFIMKITILFLQQLGISMIVLFTLNLERLDFYTLVACELKTE